MTRPQLGATSSALYAQTLRCLLSHAARCESVAVKLMYVPLEFWSLRMCFEDKFPAFLFGLSNYLNGVSVGV